MAQIGQSRALVTARNLPKTLLVSGLILGTLVVLFLVPKEFQLKAEGSLQPVIRSDVFFTANGEVEKVLVDHGQVVKQGELLVELKNNELEQELLQRQADLASAEESLRTILRRLEKGLQTDLSLFAQKVELEVKINGYRKQLNVLNDKLARLRVRSPIAGRVTSWDVENTLRDRPVTVGQVAMEVADPSGPWELIVYLPDNRIGHLSPRSRGTTSPGFACQFCVEKPHGRIFYRDSGRRAGGRWIARRTRIQLSHPR